MPIDLGNVAAATVSLLAPFTPFLLETGQAVGKKLGEVIVEKGGEKAWQKAQAMWDKLKNRFVEDPEVNSAATLVAAKPDDETRQAMLVEVLTARLNESPTLAQDLLDLLGGQDKLQEILADRGSRIEDVNQQMKDKGKQTVKASDESTIKNIRQNLE